VFVDEDADYDDDAGGRAGVHRLQNKTENLGSYIDNRTISAA